MGECFNVIALISGGKDSFYSMLQCIQNGHKIIALGNLYPPDAQPNCHSQSSLSDSIAGTQDLVVNEQDLNSFMYQTVGHTVIPLYESALGIPLYRQRIQGSAIQTGTSYTFPTAPVVGSSPETIPQHGMEDETESLIPLLMKIMAEHPEANAVSTGAILSTYQRTRVESVALRLGLVPLSFLWQYPTLPPGTQTSLLRDMQDLGLDARIVKVASGGLDETFLWENVASESSIRRLERSMKRFGVDGDGGVLGEGGEFETLVVDGPSNLFKGRITIEVENRKVVNEGGGTAWLKVSDAKVAMKTPGNGEGVCRIPDTLEQRFRDILSSLSDICKPVEGDSKDVSSLSSSVLDTATRYFESSIVQNSVIRRNDTLYWTIRGYRRTSSHTMADEAAGVVLEIRQLLQQAALDSSSIISTTIILRSMQDFAAVNSVYGLLFAAPNPPSRVTVSCGCLLPEDTNMIIHIILTTGSPLASQRKGLHVQSRSYWAPANIGPYSQASSITIPSSNDFESNISVVSIAGQIPLIPSSMTLPPPSVSSIDDFKLQTVISLQHLFRIGIAMSVSWFTGTVAYLSSTEHRSSATLTIAERSRIAGQAWKRFHARSDFLDIDGDDDQPRDLWEEKYHAGHKTMGQETVSRKLPDWDILSVSHTIEGKPEHPAFWAAEVEELPRSADIEWAALSGIAGGSIKLASTRKEDLTIEECSYGKVVQSIIKVQFQNSNTDVEKTIEHALKSLNLEADVGAVASWLDFSISGIGHAQDSQRYGAIMPCKSIWDAEGRRLAAVLVIGGMAQD